MFDGRLLLGNETVSATNECEASDRGSGLDAAISYLMEALQILDMDGEHPELGARIQEVIDALEVRLGTQHSICSTLQ